MPLEWNRTICFLYGYYINKLYNLLFWMISQSFTYMNEHIPTWLGAQGEFPFFIDFSAAIWYVFIQIRINPHIVIWGIVDFFLLWPALNLSIVTVRHSKQFTRLSILAAEDSSWMASFLTSGSFKHTHPSHNFPVSTEPWWQCGDLCLLAPPLKWQTFLSVADMSTMSGQHVGSILLCQPFFWLWASCWWDLLPTHTPTCT